MLCYKDKTFCPFYEDCKFGTECDRALTPEVIKQAEHWWREGSAVPIAQFAGKPRCWEEK